MSHILGSHFQVNMVATLLTSDELLINPTAVLIAVDR